MRCGPGSSDSEQLALRVCMHGGRSSHRRRLAQQAQYVRFDPVDRMAPSSTVLVVRCIACIVPRHQAGTHEVGNRPADIGAPDGLDLLFDSCVDPDGIACRIASQFRKESCRYARP